MDEIHCKYCGSSKVIRRGYVGEDRKPKYQCLDEDHPEGARRYFTVGENDSSLDESEYTASHDFINIVVSSERILTEEDIIGQFEVDTTKWEIYEFQVKTSEGYRKDKQIDWHVKDGKVTEGNSIDSGKMLVVPLFHIRAKFRRKTEEIRAGLAIQDMIDDLRKKAPSYPKIQYKRSHIYDKGLLYEIDIPDIHFGRLTWEKESGEDYDIRIAHHAVHSVLDELLLWIKNQPVSGILLPIGNDFFNVNNKDNTTVHGTPQQEDTRWQKTFTSGRRLAQEMIEKCLEIAPVDVVVMPGNHDEEKTFYLGEVLDAAYSKHPNVKIDNSPKTRKYRLHGTNLIGFAHGYDEKLYRLPALMAIDEPELWGKSKYREFHTGDKHHKFDTSEDGITVRILRSLAARDAWTFRNGFVGSIRAAEAFLWHPEKGVIAQYTAQP